MSDTRPRPIRKELMSLTGPQMKIVAVVAVPLVMACILVSLVESYFILTTFARSTSELQASLVRQVHYLSLLVAVVILLVTVPICALAAVWVSHRIVGPLQRLSNDLRGVAQGRIDGGFILRDGDDLIFLADAMIDMKSGLRDRVTALQANRAKIDDLAQRLESAAAQSNSADVTEVARQLKQVAADLKAQLDVFQLTTPARKEEPKSEA